MPIYVTSNKSKLELPDYVQVKEGVQVREISRQAVSLQDSVPSNSSSSSMYGVLQVVACSSLTPNIKLTFRAKLALGTAHGAAIQRHLWMDDLRSQVRLPHRVFFNLPPQGT